MKVGDMMTKGVIYATPETKIDKVAELLTENKIHGMPVVENEKVVGIIVEDDFFTKGSLSIHLPSYIDFLKKAKVDETLEGSQKKDVTNLFEIKASDIMTKDCMTVLPEMRIAEVVYVFKKTGHKTFPVVDSEGKLVGIITMADILRLF
jgi:CBS domain-containing protein